MSGTVQPIKVGEKFGQIRVTAAGKLLVREVEVVEAPTLSRPVLYRITRNDAHPHRIGKLARIGQSGFRVKYRAVES